MRAACRSWGRTKDRGVEEGCSRYRAVAVRDGCWVQMGHPLETWHLHGFFLRSLQAQHEARQPAGPCGLTGRPHPRIDLGQRQLRGQSEERIAGHDVATACSKVVHERL